MEISHEAAEQDSEMSRLTAMSVHHDPSVYHRTHLAKGRKFFGSDPHGFNLMHGQVALDSAAVSAH